jgi:hypothetical protein
MVTGTFAELSALASDTLYSPAVLAPDKNYDWFIWNDTSVPATPVLRMSHGDPWTSNILRSPGTEIIRVQGVWLNTNDIHATKGPRAQRGTYVGTTRTGSDGLFIWQLGGSAFGGLAALLGVWNCYNRVSVQTIVRDTTATWTYANPLPAAGEVFNAANHSLNNRISFVTGLAEDSYFAIHYENCNNPNGSALYIGVGLDDPTARAEDSVRGGSYNAGVGNGPVTVWAYHAGLPILGYHDVYAIENPWGTASTIYAGGTFQALTYLGRM